MKENELNVDVETFEILENIYNCDHNQLQKLYSDYCKNAEFVHFLEKRNNHLKGYERAKLIDYIPKSSVIYPQINCHLQKQYSENKRKHIPFWELLNKKVLLVTERYTTNNKVRNTLKSSTKIYHVTNASAAIDFVNNNKDIDAVLIDIKSNTDKLGKSIKSKTMIPIIAEITQNLEVTKNYSIANVLSAGKIEKKGFLKAFINGAQQENINGQK